MTESDAVLAEISSALENAFGSKPSRASISFVGVEPIEVLRFRSGDTTSHITLGMARRPMTGAEEATIAADGPRAELIVQTYTDGGELWRHLAVLGASPAVEGVVYREHMTLDLGVPLAVGSRCTGGIVTASALPAIETQAGSVDILRLLPATPTELAWARVRGAPALLELWQAQGVDPLDLERSAAALDRAGN